MEKIYLLKKKKLMYGPFSLNYFKEKGLRQDDFVWFEGLKDWTLATEIDFLKPFIILKETNISKKKSLFNKVLSFLD